MTDADPPAPRVEQLAALFDRLDPAAQRQVFTHTSWVEERTDSYERAAFLGDSVLALAVSTHLYPRFEQATAGGLTQIRAQAVSGRACARVALALDVPDRMAQAAPQGESEQAYALASNERALASICEAIIGECYLEFGYEEVAPAVVEAFSGEIEDALTKRHDFKSALQEHLARDGKRPAYVTVSESGPAHSREFQSAVEVDGDELGRGGGRSKKDAEQAAAAAALDKLEQVPAVPSDGTLNDEPDQQ